MATTRGQRLGIWIITGVLAVGTIGGFIAMMVQPGNDARDQAELKQAQEDYQKKITEYQNKLAQQASELSGRYHGTFAPHAARVAAFDAAAVTELATEDIVVGEGAEVKDDTKLAVYYVGWNPKGEIFDQSIENDTLKAPFTVDGPAKESVIQGWKEGLVGMKIGGVRELTIPAAKAYGEQGKGEKIPANTPLKFVVMAVEAPADIPQPEVPEAIKTYYKRLGVGA